MNTNAPDLSPVGRLSRDLANASITLTEDEARFLVDAYYMMQANRIRTHGQIRSMDKREDGQPAEPHLVLDWLAVQSETLEDQIKRALDKYSAAHPVGEWMRSNKGVGPVIAAGFLAHIDINRAPTAGHIWSYAGLNPTARWEKGQKRPWNADLKTLCWKLGESFVKVSGSEDAYYGQVYRQRKALEVERNEAGANAQQAASILAAKKIGKDTDAYRAYSAGRLPPAHIHARARRYAVKLFIAHMHEVWYKRVLGREPPAPYPIAILGHAHRILPPNQ